MQEIDIENAFRLIEPGPILLVTTHGADGPNVMTMGFHMMVQHVPPLVGCVIGPWDHSYRTLRETGECVLSVPRAEMSAIVTDIGNTSGTDTDKFEMFSMATMSGAAAEAPPLAGCIANLECRLVDQALSDRYSLHILEVEHLWAAPDWREAPMLHHIGDGRFRMGWDLVEESRRMTRRRHLVGLGAKA